MDDERSTKLEEICKELDALTLSYLTKLEEYTVHWQDAGKQMGQGFLHLAHAKYTMGAGTISQFSYDKRMKAQLIIESEDYPHPKLRISNRPFVEDTEEDGYENSEKEEKHVDNPSEGLRRRQGHKPADENESEWVKEVLEDSTDNGEYEMNEKRPIKSSTKGDKKKTMKDPLHWFGLLVSPSLRASQHHFKAATAELIEQINRVNELKTLETRFHELKSLKLELMEKDIVINGR
ncbi:hypothetical protein EC973_006565 [Apophysomyces ossiformis]|uniref:Vacuolar ATPase assembly protein VMA22 n=1 Tax=Apophysomyces ossiformis TaxID=679940 RepID=A0A8H7BQZ5_9FUNG|nr:hypothetical protein EC973_006565 [Apophysomyces ossiformis]